MIGVFNIITKLPCSKLTFVDTPEVTIIIPTSLLNIITIAFEITRWVVGVYNATSEVPSSKTPIVSLSVLHVPCICDIFVPISILFNSEPYGFRLFVDALVFHSYTSLI